MALMAVRLNHGWNIASFAFYFCAMCGILAGCAFLLGTELAGPVMFLSAVWSCFGLWRQRSLMRSHLKQHDAAHEFSPNLRRIVDEVCAAAGRNPARVPVYDYSLNRPQGEVSPSKLRQLGGYLLSAKMHSAATTGDMLLVSVPLLKLLDDDEEKAVFAHEMAHIVLKHAFLGGLLWIVRRMAYHVAMVYWMLAVWQGGWAAVAVVVCVPFAVNLFVRARYPAWKKKGKLTIEESSQRGWAGLVYIILYYPLLLGLLGWLAPGVIKAYLVLLLVTYAGGIVAGLASQSTERQADAGAVQLGGDPLAMAMALRKIVFLQQRAQQKLFERKSSSSSDGLLDAYIQLYATHPRLEDRVEALCQTAYRSGMSWARMQEVRRGDINIPADHDIPEDVVRAFNRM